MATNIHGTKTRGANRRGAAKRGLKRFNPLAKRIATVAKRTHQASIRMFPFSLPGEWSSVSTSGTAVNLCDSIQIGSDYTQRLGNRTDSLRINIKGSIFPNGSSTLARCVRISIVEADSIFAFGTNMTGTYSPVASGVALGGQVTRLFYDKFFSVAAGATNGPNGYGTDLDISVSVKGHHQKYQANSVTDTTGACLWVIIQSDAASGSNPPVLQGVCEFFFLA